MKILLTICSLLFTVSVAFATHIAGGEIRLTKNGTTPYVYDLELIMFFDDIHADDGLIDTDLTIYLDAFDKATNQMVETFSLSQIDKKTFVIDDTVGCSVLGTRIIRYKASVTLSPDLFSSPDGYYITWQRCCRNQGIKNIYEPDDIGNAFYLEIPSVKSVDGSDFINSTPHFGTPNKEILCKFVNQHIDFSATDADEDSLVYSLVHPFAGHGSLNYGASPSGMPAPYPLVTFAYGYSIDSMIPGEPSLAIDSATGILSVVPNEEGLFAFAIQVEEFRGGKRIGLTRRDFQILVLDCTDSIPMPCYETYHPEEHKEKIIAYPNPANNELYLSSGHHDPGFLQVKIFNSSGSLILEKTIESEEPVFISSLTTGLYYIWVFPEKGDPQKISLLKK